MPLLFWKETEEQIKERASRETKYRENYMKNLLEKIDKRDPEALKEAVEFLTSLSEKNEHHDFVHTSVVNLRKILWPAQQDPTVYETPVKNYSKALKDLLDLGLNKFRKLGTQSQNQSST